MVSGLKKINHGRRKAVIVIDYQDRRPLYEQITEKFRNLIIQGILEPGTIMPSARSLAVELSINPNTIQRAYSALEQEGLIYPVKGKGNYVSPNQDLIRHKLAQYRNELENAVIRASRQGISMEEMISLIKNVFADREGGKYDSTD